MPGDARAWAGFAFCRVTQYWRGDLAGQPEIYQQAREAVDRAVALDPNLPQAWETMAMALGPVEFRWAEAHDAIRKAHALAPGNGGILMMLGHFDAVMGDIARRARSERARARARSALREHHLESRAGAGLGGPERRGRRGDPARAGAEPGDRERLGAPGVVALLPGQDRGGRSGRA